jgi:glycosyltransferase involved in cell wall biosynthesis
MRRLEMTELKMFETVNSSSENELTKFFLSPSLAKNVCVVLTAYNDEEAIGSSVKEFLSQRNVSNVIVVDNNSKDKTASTAFNAGATVVKESNQGYGFACRRGLFEALNNSQADIIVLAEGDMTFRGRDMWKLLPFLDDADLVVGSRTHMAYTDLNSQMDWFYVWGNLFIAKILELRFSNFRFLSRTRFTDVGCTMRAINKDALEKIIDDLTSGGMHFSPHMMKVALKKDLRVVEVPITFRKRVGISKGASGSKSAGLKIGLRMVWHIIAE